MAHNPELTRAFNERRKWRDRVLALCLAVESSRANFSPGDEWTPTDERVAFQIDQLHASIEEAAERLTRAAMAHRMAMDEAELQTEADRLAEE